jgi:hypothetical protein
VAVVVVVGGTGCSLEAILTQRLLAFPGVFLWEHLCVRACVCACVRVFVSRRWTGA